MAEKRKSSFMNMVLTLFLVTAIAAMALGAIYNLTKEPIALAILKKQQEAIKAVLPEFDSLQTIMVPAKTGDSLLFNLAFKQGAFVGAAVNTYTNKGYSGNIQLMVGFFPDGKISNTMVLKHKETPGLGDKMQKNKSDWSDQVNGKDPSQFQLKVTKDGGDVDAITAATITSRAFCDAVERAYQSYQIFKLEEKE